MKRDPAAPLGTECRRGMMVGGANGMLFAVIAGASPAGALLAVCGAGALGALIGLLVWSGSDAVRDDPVPPPKAR